MKMKGACFLFAAITLTAASAALAGDGSDSEFRCGQQLVDLGSTKTEVLQWCGEPTEKMDGEWVYVRGDTEPAITLHFEDDGTVNRISAAPLD
ncbi:DUF2845 domain-containing protein [Pseudomonas sp. N040]|uniref:DUF2845 domain-containing protein n=1 Tax=Pseudomonas sp. N040 TaxID=2785325 RepID=UPI001E602F92|nr:DUF2845 domain-containing protein [Pseudomonas sp. N040]